MTLHTLTIKLLELYEPLDCSLRLIKIDRENELDYLPSDLSLLLVRATSDDLIEETEIVYKNDSIADVHSLISWELDISGDLKYRKGLEPTLINYALGYSKIEDIQLKSKFEIKEITE